MASDMLRVTQSACDDDYHRHPPLKSPCLGKYLAHNLHISQRTLLHETVTLEGWPSRGGIILLEDATPPDFDFLQLDPLDPPLRRDADQSAEDIFCQSLLRLGATWWDSEAQKKFIRKLEAGDSEAFEAVDADEAFEPSRLVRAWVRVAWQSQPNPPGAVYVLACEKIIIGGVGSERVRPRHFGTISLARTMDERCTILQQLGGTMYFNVNEVQDPTFLNA